MSRKSMPVACSLDGAEFVDRRDEWLALGARALIDKETTTSGVRLRFHALSGVDQELSRLVAAERECCGFATWIITDGTNDLVLEITAPDEGVAAVHAMFEG